MANIGNGAIVGQINEQVTAVAANYTVVPTDQLVQVTTGGASAVIVVTLPKPVIANAVGTIDASSAGNPGNQGQRVTVQKVDAANGTVDIKGTLNVGKDYALTSRWSAATFISDGVNWNLTATVS